MDSVFGKVVWIRGAEPVQAQRFMDLALLQAKKESPDAEILIEIASELDSLVLESALQGSIFSNHSIIIIKKIENLNKACQQLIIDLLKQIPSEISLILWQADVVKVKNLFSAITKAKAEIREATLPKTWQIPQFILNEVRIKRGKIDTAAVSALASSIGTDTVAISSAISQLLADSAGHIDLATVNKYFSGRADVTRYSVADAILTKNLNQALEQARWLLETGESPVAIVAALADSFRQLGKFSAFRRANLSDREIAKKIGIFEWKIKTLAKQSRFWYPEDLAKAQQEIALADQEAKGLGPDPFYTIEKLLIRLLYPR